MLKFGPDGKLYLFMGDQGRRGWLQNLPNGPFLTAPQVDDTVRRPRAGQRPPHRRDLPAQRRRLHARRTTRSSPPGAAIGGEVGANIQKIFSYGHRNGFGMAFDPLAGSSGTPRTPTTPSASSTGWSPA